MINFPLEIFVEQNKQKQTKNGLNVLKQKTDCDNKNNEKKNYI